MEIAIHVLFCWLIADFLSGLFHWAEDRYFHSDWPILGPAVAAPNELHHSDPTAFVNQGYWSRNYTTIVPALAVGVLVAIIDSWWCLPFLFLTQANEIHAWSHQRHSWWVAMLGEIGVIQSARHHSKHHRSPYEVRYCVMTGWVNPVLDEFGFWRVLEWSLMLAGIRPKEPKG